MTKKLSQEAEKILENLKKNFGKNIKSATYNQIYQACAICVREDIIEAWMHKNALVDELGKKRLYYMSAEFLIGRALVNNMLNLKSYEKYKQALNELDIDINEIEEQEHDPGLGNGGLGRLAACFLESLSSLDYPAMGCGIRYEHGLFRQRILEGEQVELVDDWIDTGAVWEIERPEETVEIHFGGYIEEQWTEHGLKIELKNFNTVLAVPYDMPIVGASGNISATLRLWSARAKSDIDLTYFNKGEYARASEEKELAEVISKVLYPEDNHVQGKQLRLKQFYFFSSATMQYIIKKHKERFYDLHSLPDYVCIQINDTHPTVCIPELIRILLDEEGFTWDEAYSIAERVFNYTNHTIMPEALEKWEKTMFKSLLPRIYSIICEINDRYCKRLFAHYNGDIDKISNMSIIAYNEVRMANLCVAVCGNVNGVSMLHSDLLKNKLFRGESEIFKNKFTGITNGVTHRRWLCKANMGLADLMKQYIGDGFINDYREFSKLAVYADDNEFIKKYAEVKKHNKERLADYVFKCQGIKINPGSIFDVQAKRLHEYKRQLMKVLHIIELYNAIKKDPSSFTQPCTFFFGAKAAPGYARAKNIIRLINSVADMVNNDCEVNKVLQVVFIENYSVSAAEILIPAADISEQISTAGMEASGTGNMKFMMNGALTIGTMDGANVEIYNAVGENNIYIFGANVEKLQYMEKYKTYFPEVIYEQNSEIRDAVSKLIDGSLPGISSTRFYDIYRSLLFGDNDKPDKYYTLLDLPHYAERFSEMVELYSNKKAWYRKAVINTAASGMFSSDRTIEDYNRLIWGLEKIE